jgi:hypothetical protein
VQAARYEDAQDVGKDRNCYFEMQKIDLTKANREFAVLFRIIYGFQLLHFWFLENGVNL